MIHCFPEDFVFEEPSEFTDPFRYAPHPSVRLAAEFVMQQIELSGLTSDFSEGKMLGVLVCRRTTQVKEESDVKTPVYYIAAFSGNAGGRSKIAGFVPPIYDLLDPSGDFKKREAEISAVNAEIDRLLGTEEYSSLLNVLALAENGKNKELEAFRSAMAESKARRDRIRATCNDKSVLSTLVRESQYEKAELRRLKSSWENKTAELKLQLNRYTEKIESLKKQRASMSESLQDWIFRQYIVHNASGEESSIAEIFARSGMIPPGGTGECAAPKLLEYAYRNGLEPLAMGEFWYGQPSTTAVRTHGRFYPSCTSKCGPLLGFMLDGLRAESGSLEITCIKNKLNIPDISYEDDALIIVEKPSGMPSVPGLDGRKSLLEWLQERYNGIQAVHRLDMDTSGVMIFAKTSEAAVNLRRQFEEHSVRKTYMARLSCGSALGESVSGSINLPLSPDYDERPRQKVDFRQGKETYTEYEIVKENQDGTADLLLYPQTGRTHQLRVHCAHSLGLSRPILGDMLYGGETADRLHLHALSVTFSHPVTEEVTTFTADKHNFENSSAK